MQKIKKSLFKLYQNLNLFLANAPHQGVAALIAPYEYADFDQFLKQQKEKEGLSTVLILDGLEDPHNLGINFKNSRCNGS